jgi:hypothetical protein
MPLALLSAYQFWNELNRGPTDDTEFQNFLTQLKRVRPIPLVYHLSDAMWHAFSYTVARVHGIRSVHLDDKLMRANVQNELNKSLKHIVFTQVIQRETRNVAQEILTHGYDTTDLTYPGLVLVRPDEKVSSKQDADFYAMIGTPFGLASAYLCLHRENELGPHIIQLVKIFYQTTVIPHLCIEFMLWPENTKYTETQESDPVCTVSSDSKGKSPAENKDLPRESVGPEAETSEAAALALRTR